MKYYELVFTYEAAIETGIISDVLAAELGEIGFESFTESETGLTGYVPENAFDESGLKDKLDSFPLENVTIHFTKKLIADKNWNEEWEKNYFQPITIGHECIIHASFHHVEPGYTYDIVIDPKMAFGTGNHETTYLMINELLPHDLKQKEVLDMGCGTAVLAILAAKMGARRVVAVDIDEWAYRNALDNIRLNHTPGIEVAKGGAEQIPRLGKFDIVLANINRNILLNDIKAYASCMKHGALLYMSGFYRDDIPVIEEECAKYNLTLASYQEKNRWVAVKMKHITT